MTAKIQKELITYLKDKCKGDICWSDDCEECCNCANTDCGRAIIDIVERLRESIKK